MKTIRSLSLALMFLIAVPMILETATRSTYGEVGLLALVICLIAYGTADQTLKDRARKNGSDAGGNIS